ncbi:MAG: RDD family protein [Candidatus Nanohaloarchaea archaeon]
MKQSELEERVAESLEQGYQLDEVRDALRSEGYSRDRIREAMEDGKKLYQNDFDFEPGEQDPVSGLTTGARDVDEEEVTGGRDVNIRKGDDDRGPEGLPEPAELSDRAHALFFDFVAMVPVLAVLYLLFFQGLGFVTSFEVAVLLPAFVIGFTGNFLYHFFAEWIWGKTVGKHAVGIEVVKDDGTEIGPLRSFARNALRAVDSNPVFGVPWGVALFFIHVRDDNKRLGDIVASTRVVES